MDWTMSDDTVKHAHGPTLCGLVHVQSNIPRSDQTQHGPEPNRELPVPPHGKDNKRVRQKENELLKKKD